ncbi:MAG: hypothetical protein NZ651_06835, partial [Candidatus Bipolaricaulota bacterium]|nr:hypothetical protein [Candidatus Bipolaricaulota bacterium]MDW8127470.1 hypothetical protein [Candidatus Bipolaricaulota bacterium]
VYMAPLHLYGYLLGRGVAKTLVATISVLVTLAFGMAFLKVRFSLGSPGLLVAALVLGLAALAFYGILLAGVSLFIARHGWMVGDVVAGGLYLLCGAAFPLALLPTPFRALGLGLPPTYWLEALRRALLGQGLHQELASFSNSTVLSILAGATFLGVVLSIGLFHIAERMAVRRGLLDMQTMY